MKAITSKEKLLKKLKNHALIYGIDRFYLSDFHKTPVGRVLANKMIEKGELEKTVNYSWFEAQYRLTRKD